MWQKRWFRWTVRILALVALATLAGIFYLRLHGENELAEARKEFEAKVGPLDPAAYQTKAPQEEENGAVWLRAGARAVVIFQPERAGLKSLAETPSSRWTPAQVAQFKVIQERNAPALALLDRAAGTKVCDVSAVPGAEDRWGMPSIKAARLLAADAREAASQGDVERFFRRAEALSVLAAAAEREPETLMLLVGSYAERLFYMVLQEAAGSPSLDKAAVARLGGLVPKVALMEVWQRSRGKEMAEFEARMAKGTEEDYLGMKPSWSARLKEWILGDLDHAAYLRMWCREMPWTLEPCGLRSPSPPPPPRTLLMGAWSTIGSIQTPSLSAAAGRLQATLALRQMARLGLQIRQMGLEAGAYPSALAAFPDARVPDPFTGKPVQYTVHSDGSATLAIPDGDALYRKISLNKNLVLGASWTLPPPSREASRRK